MRTSTSCRRADATPWSSLTSPTRTRASTPSWPATHMERPSARPSSTYKSHDQPSLPRCTGNLLLNTNQTSRRIKERVIENHKTNYLTSTPSSFPSSPPFHSINQLLFIPLSLPLRFPPLFTSSIHHSPNPNPIPPSLLPLPPPQGQAGEDALHP